MGKKQSGLVSRDRAGRGTQVPAEGDAAHRRQLAGDGRRAAVRRPAPARAWVVQDYGALCPPGSRCARPGTQVVGFARSWRTGGARVVIVKPWKLHSCWWAVLDLNQ